MKYKNKLCACIKFGEARHTENNIVVGILGIAGDKIADVVVFLGDYGSDISNLVFKNL